jgi:hypothetical protein
MFDTKTHTSNQQEQKIILQKIGETLTQFKEVELAYVFGSFLKGTYRDIDIALLLKETLPPYQSLKLALKIGNTIEQKLNYPAEIDTRILNTTPIQFQHEVIKTGKIIHCKNETKRITYETKVLNTYLDYKPILEFFNKQLIKDAI